MRIPDLEITRLNDAEPKTLAALAVLITQLSSRAPVLLQHDLMRILKTPTTAIFVARADGMIVGMVTCVTLHVATGTRAFIDDVVVAQSHRGQRIGEKLVRAAIDHGRAEGASKTDLTSRPTREAAKRLYQRLGFQKRETNVYRLQLN